jgi:hypothetical protein
MIIVALFLILYSIVEGREIDKEIKEIKKTNKQ